MQLLNWYHFNCTFNILTYGNRVVLLLVIIMEGIQNALKIFLLLLYFILRYRNLLHVLYCSETVQCSVSARNVLFWTRFWLLRSASHFVSVLMYGILIVVLYHSPCHFRYCLDVSLQSASVIHLLYVRRPNNFVIKNLILEAVHHAELHQEKCTACILCKALLVQTFTRNLMKMMMYGIQYKTWEKTGILFFTA